MMHEITLKVQDLLGQTSIETINITIIESSVQPNNNNSNPPSKDQGTSSGQLEVMNLITLGILVIIILCIIILMVFMTNRNKKLREEYNRRQAEMAYQQRQAKNGVLNKSQATQPTRSTQPRSVKVYAPSTLLTLPLREVQDQKPYGHRGHNLPKTPKQELVSNIPVQIQASLPQRSSRSTYIENEY